MQNTPSPELRRLAALVRAQLLREAGPAAPVDAALVQFAVERHRVDPLLHVAVVEGRASADADTTALLARRFQRNVSRQARSDIFLQELAKNFAAIGMPWLAFKGLPLARQLYPNPTWRHSNDVDVLVPAARFAQAERMLRDSGMTVMKTDLPSDHWIERFGLAISKDVMLQQARSGVSIELHRRLFFGSAEENRVPMLREAFRPRLAATPREIPSPPLDAALTLYLLLHGASSRWFRLKWLADLLPLMAKLDDAQMRAVIEGAKTLKATIAAKAALELLVTVFGDVPLGVFGDWVKEPGDRARVETRTGMFLRALDELDSVYGHLEGRRFDGIDMHLTIMGGLRYRGGVLLRGAAWTGVKALRRVWGAPGG